MIVYFKWAACASLLHFVFTPSSAQQTPTATVITRCGTLWEFTTVSASNYCRSLFLAWGPPVVKCSLCSVWPILLHQAVGRLTPPVMWSLPKYDIRWPQEILYNTRSPVFIALKILIKFWATNHHDPRCLLLGFLPALAYSSVFRQLSEGKGTALNKVAPSALCLQMQTTVSGDRRWQLPTDSPHCQVSESPSDCGHAASIHGFSLFIC